MSRSRLVTILLAIIMATAAAGGVYTLVSETQPQSAAIESPKTPTPMPMAGVLVARLDIAAGATLTTEMLEVKDVPTALRHARALSSLDQAVGKMAAVSLVRGEQILDSRVTGAPVAELNSFAGSVPAGMRAISVVFDEVIGAGALVQPGDHVDVLGYFEVDVTDSGASVAGNDDFFDEEGSNSASTEEKAVKYTQYLSVYVVQDVEVLAVSQALSPDQLGIEGQDTTQPTPTAVSTDDLSADATETPQPVARPAANSVTLAVTPEQAQRLLLAAQTVTRPHSPDGGFLASLRLVLRSPGDTTVVDLGPAQLGSIPVGDLLGDVDRPMVPSDLVVTDAEFIERVLPSGGVLEFTVTVKNVSDETITSGTDAPPGYEYSQGIAYDALGFFPEDDSYRLGLSFAGAYPNPFPYRWGLGGDLEPGESVEITGSVRLTEPTPATRYWFGIIQESNTVTQDGMGVADISVVPSEAGTIGPRSVEVHDGPRESAEVVANLARGDEVIIIGVQNAWFQIRAGEVEGWITASELNVPALGSDSVEPVASPVSN